MTARPAPTVGLASLAAALEDACFVGSLGGEVRAIAHDSRCVTPGALFVALRGERADGHAYLERALARGAVGVVVDRTYAAMHELPVAATTIVVTDTRRALSRLAAAFYGYPASALRVAGITGTNGKTTTTQLLAAILAEGGVRAGTIGTLGATFGGVETKLENTTPLALELQMMLGDMHDRGASTVVMEVSSHALALARVADVRFAVAALTNVTRDHLDFHADVESYAAAKRSLFAQTGHAILNLDDSYGASWARELRAAGTRVTTYALERPADIVAHDVVVRSDGSSFVVDGRAFATRLPGRFNVANALAAIALGRSLGCDDATSARALAAFASVPGRMQHLGDGEIDVLVDYAHTPDALRAVLGAARETTHGALAVVFGCGGDRDRGKRPLMGAVAAELADRIYLTSDNPRSEDPRTIVAEIAGGIPLRRAAIVELDRSQAIRRAIAAAAPGDVVVVAGKGHETVQIAETGARHFDDCEEVRAALAARTEHRL